MHVLLRVRTPKMFIFFSKNDAKLAPLEDCLAHVAARRETEVPFTMISQSLTAPRIKPWRGATEFRSVHLSDAAKVELALGTRTECVQLSAGPFAAEMLELHAGAVSVRSLSCNRAFQ